MSTSSKPSSIPDQVYLLQGSILDTHVEALKHRLKGLCDNVDLSSPNQEMFHEREMVFVAGGGVYGTNPQAGNPSAMPTFHASSSTPKVQLRLRRPIPINTPVPSNPPNTVNHGPNVMVSNNSNLPPWQLRYLGQTEALVKDGKSGVMPLIRTCYDVPVSESAVDFVLALGFRLDYEYVAKGFMFRKGRLKVTISKLYRITNSIVGGSNYNSQSTIMEQSSTSPAIVAAIMGTSVHGAAFIGMSGNNNNIESIGRSHLVELSSISFSGGNTASMNLVDEMRSFAEQLKPLIVLDRIDERKALIHVTSNNSNSSLPS